MPGAQTPQRGVRTFGHETPSSHENAVRCDEIPFSFSTSTTLTKASTPKGLKWFVVARCARKSAISRRRMPREDRATRVSRRNPSSARTMPALELRPPTDVTTELKHRDPPMASAVACLSYLCVQALDGHLLSLCLDRAAFARVSAFGTGPVAS